MKSLLRITTTITLLTLLSLPIGVQAQSEDIGLSIRPAVVELAGEPGSSQTAEIAIQNTSDIPIPITARPTGLIPIDNEIDQERRTEFDASSWISIPDPNFILEPEEIVAIPVLVDIPDEANPGGHYAQVAMKVLSELRPLENSLTQIAPEISASFFITVSGDIVEEATLNTEKMVAGYVNKGSTTKLKFDIINSGNVHILPIPKVTILDGNDEIVEQISLQPQLILPNTYKQFELDWQADVDFGSYKAQVELIYGSASIPLASQAVGFTVGPAIWQLVLLAVTGLIVLALILLRANVPAALAALKGKRIPVPGKFLTKKDVQELDPDKTAASDYEVIAEFLGDSKPEKYLKPLPPMKKESNPPLEKPDRKEVIKKATKKTAEKPLEEVPISSDVTVTEFSSDDDKDSKTVIVQTSSTTIIRQEPKDKPVVKPPKKQTKAKPKPKKSIKKAPVKKIMVEVESESKPGKKKSKSTKKPAQKKKPAKKTSTKSKAKKKSTSVKK